MIHSKRFPVLIGVLSLRSVFPFTKHKATSSLGFLNEQFNYLQRAALLTSLIEYLFEQQQPVMVNYVCGFNQSETKKYFD